MSGEYLMSVNRLRKWMECPAACMAYIRGRYRAEASQAMHVGQYVTLALLQPDKLAAWIEANKDVTCKKSGELLKVFIDAEQIVAEARADAKFMDDIRGIPETTIDFDFEGVKWRAIPDIVQPETGTLVDLKRAAQMTKYDEGLRKRVPFYDGRHGTSYWSQIAMYRHAYRAKYGEFPDNCALACLIGDNPTGRRVYLMGHDPRFIVESLCAARVQREVQRCMDGGTPPRGPQVYDAESDELYGINAECDCDWCRRLPCVTVEAKSYV
jgi:hypothetical protein